MPTAHSSLSDAARRYDVRDREMSRIFNAALDKGIHVTAIFDSCHSGGISRGIGPRYIERTLAYDPAWTSARHRTLLPQRRSQTGANPTHSMNSALVFSAAQQDQTAKEMPPADKAAEPHGAFTAALIEALQVMPASTPASLIYQRVKAVLEGPMCS